MKDLLTIKYAVYVFSGGLSEGKTMKYHLTHILTLVLIIAFSYGCDNDTSSNAQLVGSTGFSVNTLAIGLVDSSGEECTGLSELAVGDRVELLINLESDPPPQLTGVGPGFLSLSNVTGDSGLSCMGDVNQDKNPLPTNIICDSVEPPPGNSSFLNLGQMIGIEISFSSDINQLKVTDLTTMDCATITIDSMTTCVLEAGEASCPK